ncbi:MAG: pre-toxin TG domain-containing protein [Pseudobdellovibrionaceae bacterium]
MGLNLDSYKRAIEDAKRALAVNLQRGKASSLEIAASRLIVLMMEEELKTIPSSVLSYDYAKPESGLTGPDLWRLKCQERAYKELTPNVSDQAYQEKFEEYLNFSLRLINIDFAKRWTKDEKNGYGYLYSPNPQILDIMKCIASELMSWVQKQLYDEKFHKMSASEGYMTMLSERPDLVALLRASQKLPADSEYMTFEIDRPTAVIVIETIVGFVPILGNAVAAYEIYSGHDLFGYKLSDTERVVMGVFLLLPAAGKFLKAGRTLYTEARLVRLYGGEAAAWSKVFNSSAKVTADPKIARMLQLARLEIKQQTHLAAGESKLAKELIEAIAKDEATPLIKQASQPAEDLFTKLSSKYASLKELDSLAIQRILDKGTNIDHIKGQVLEEMIESRVVPWLRQRTGALALGVEAPGKTLEFIPGHLIRDVKGRQITDGIIGYRTEEGIFSVLAIFEAKAGKAASRELSITKGTFSSLTQVEKIELEKYAKDIISEEQLIAKMQGRDIPKRTLEEVQKEILLTEKGGQVQRDIERLHESEIFVGGMELAVEVSPKKTKFFGVLPQDVNSSLVEKELKDLGYNFERVGVDLSSRDLKAIAEEIAKGGKGL